jgi:putative spermidine/putrescine transport system permease protein
MERSMNTLWQRWRIPLMLAPTLFVIIVLFGGGLGYGILQSLGWQPLIGETTLSLDAYINLLTSPQYAEPFWTGLLLTLWVSIISTVLSAVLAVGAALLLRRTFVGKRLATFLFQLNLLVPHVVIAIGMLFLLSQSGLVSRFGAQIGLVSTPSEFPILVRDSAGIGIILAYLWKQVPYMGVVVLATLQALGEDYEDVARSLGAGWWHRFRLVVLPLIAPGLLSASVIIFAFNFGGYEVPALLGVRYPEMLPVIGMEFFQNPDLSARAEGTAVSIIIALVVFALMGIYSAINRRVVRGG